MKIFHPSVPSSLPALDDRHPSERALQKNRWQNCLHPGLLFPVLAFHDYQPLSASPVAKFMKLFLPCLPSFLPALYDH